MKLIFLHKLFFLFIISVLALKRFAKKINTKQTNAYRTFHATLITPAVFYEPWGYFSLGLRPTPKIPAAPEKKPVVWGSPLVCSCCSQGICYPMKTPTRQHVTNAECTAAVLGLFTRSVPTRGSPNNVCVRTLP